MLPGGQRGTPAQGAPRWGAPTSGGIRATSRTSAAMLSAPTLLRMAPICVRTVHTATLFCCAMSLGVTPAHSISSTRVSAGVSFRLRAKPSTDSRSQTSRLPSSSIAKGASSSARWWLPAAGAGSGTTETLMRLAPSPSVSSRRRPRCAPASASKSGATSCGRLARSVRPISCSGCSPSSSSRAAWLRKITCASLPMSSMP
jgi:hypothetical protein